MATLPWLVRSAATAALTLWPALAGCSSVPVQQRFRHVDDRQAQALTDEELRSMRFYVERNVLVSDVQGAELASRPDGPMLVRQVDPGEVLEVGPEHLRITFAGGSGVYFVTSGTADDQHYFLATEVPGRSGLHKVKDLPEPTVLYEGKTFRIVQGADTILRVDVDDLREALAKRGLQ